MSCKFITEAIRPDDIKGVASLMMAEAESIALTQQGEERRPPVVNAI